MLSATSRVCARVSLLASRARDYPARCRSAPRRPRSGCRASAWPRSSAAGPRSGLLAGRGAARPRGARVRARRLALAPGDAGARGDDGAAWAQREGRRRAPRVPARVRELLETEQHERQALAEFILKSDERTIAQRALTVFDMVGCALFAMVGTLLGGDQGMHVVGATFVGCAASMGGGSVNGILMGNTRGRVFWIKDPRYLALCVGSSVATFYLFPVAELALARRELRAFAVTSPSDGSAAKYYARRAAGRRRHARGRRRAVGGAPRLHAARGRHRDGARRLLVLLRGARARRRVRGRLRAAVEPHVRARARDEASVAAAVAARRRAAAASALHAAARTHSDEAARARAAADAAAAAGRPRRRTRPRPRPARRRGPAARRRTRTRPRPPQPRSPRRRRTRPSP